MKRTNLEIELHKDDHLEFSIQGQDELIGIIQIARKSPSNYIHLHINFLSIIDIVRGKAKVKTPKKRIVKTKKKGV